MTRRANEYFVYEAAEYLNQLEALLGRGEHPNPDHFLRLASGVRGSARMADAETIAGLAEHLENAARLLLSGNFVWSEELRDLSRRTVEDLKLLVRAQNRLGPDEEARVKSVVAMWAVMPAPAAGHPESAVPIQELFFDDAGPHVIAAGDQEAAVEKDVEEDVEDEVVPIEPLLFQGDAALRQALALRPALEQALAGEVGDRFPGDLMEELFDLIELGRDRDPPTA
jgi:chemotaxis protein histidine kinase CheA